MPRLARLDAPGVIHHVIIRGIERRAIFRDNTDRQDLINRLAHLLPATKTACYAWALLPNHAHFLFRSGVTGLPTLMRRLLTGYAIRFNRRHRRHGQLFQNRYKSIICQEDLYLRELIRYIHLNPVRANLVSGMTGLDQYPYSGHPVIMGTKDCPWQDKDYVLSWFGSTAREGREEYYSYLKEAFHQGRRPELVGGGLIRSLGGWAEVKKLRLRGHDRIKGDERILGDGEFVMSILSEADEQMDRRFELTRLGYTLDKLAERVAAIYQIDLGELYSKGRQKTRSEARSVFCYWAVRELGTAETHIAEKLQLSQPGIAYAVRRGEQIVKERGMRIAG